MVIDASENRFQWHEDSLGTLRRCLPIRDGGRVNGDKEVCLRVLPFGTQESVSQEVEDGCDCVLSHAISHFESLNNAKRD